MLAPRAWKRTRSPAFRQSRLKDSNCRDSGRSSLVQSAPVQSALVQSETAPSAVVQCGIERSVTETENPLHGALVGLEGIAIARDRVRDPLQNVERGTHILMAMKWNKAAGKKFGDCLAAGKAG